MDNPVGPAPAPARRTKFVVGGAIVVATLLGLVVWATARPNSTAYYMTPSELMSANAPRVDREVRLNGTVVPGSIEKSGLATTFTVTDGTTEVDVATDRPLPDAFQDRSEVVARGSIDGGNFVAVEVLAKCPSKFKARA